MAAGFSDFAVERVVEKVAHLRDSQNLVRRYSIKAVRAFETQVEASPLTKQLRKFSLVYLKSVF